MQHIERKKLVTIFAVIIAAVLAGVVITISIIFSGSQKTPENTNEPTPVTTSNPSNSGEPVEGGAPIGDSDDPDAPPATMYENDYSKDLGYTPLPETFDKNVSPTEDTIYNDEYVYVTYNRVMCELSAKQTSTTRALEPLKALVKDLKKNGSSISTNYASEGAEQIVWFEDRLNQRIDATKRSELELIHCKAGNLDYHDHADEDHNDEE
jgi:hypothetical protein